MCGIAGLIGERSHATAERLLEKIRHRGPDGDGIWVSPSDESPVTLCHSRLAILDLSSSGSQPFHSEDHRYTLVFNGEIYNFLELRNYLSHAYNHRFRSQTDTEVLLQGLIFEGQDFLKKCNGMWAFCLWDRREGRATICRDRFGVKPLYYASLTAGRLAFASEMKALAVVLESISPSQFIDSIFLHQFDYEFSDLCAIEGIARLPPGSYAVIKDRRIEVSQWWNTLDHIHLDDSGYSNQVDQWRDIFFDSVKLRMRSDVPLGTALSGGLDSSSVLAVMSRIGRSTQPGEKRIANDWQHAVCSTYPGSSLDETQWAQHAAESCGVAFSSVAIDPMNSSWGLLRSLAQVEDPYLTMPLPMLATYQRIKSLGVSVTLDGHGADELFCGYGHLQSALTCALSYSQYQEILAIDKSTRTGVYSSNEKTRAKAKLKGFIKFLLSKHGSLPRSALKVMRSGRRFFRADSDDSDPFASKLMEARRAIEGHDSYRAMDAFSQVLYEIFHLTILPTLLRNYDRYSMANGLEVRMPFMDWRLVCYTFSLPWQSKLGGTYTKRIQRDAVSGILSDPIRLRRDKVGWNAPAHEWLRGDLRPVIEETLKLERDTPYFTQALAAWDAYLCINQPSFIQGQQVWNQILPQLWMQSLRTPIWN